MIAKNICKKNNHTGNSNARNNGILGEDDEESDEVNNNGSLVVCIMD